MIRGGTQKSEITLAEHNSKLEQRCDFRFSGPPSEHADFLGARIREFKVSVRHVPRGAQKIWNHNSQPTFDSVLQMWSQISWGPLGTPP